MGEINALRNVALEALDGLAQKCLLLLGNTIQGVGSFLRTIGLAIVSRSIFHRGGCRTEGGGTD